MAAYQGGQRSGRGKRKAPARPTASKPSDKRTNLPGGRSKPKPKPKEEKGLYRGNYTRLEDTEALREKAYSALQWRGYQQKATAAPTAPARLTKAPPAPKLPAPTRTTVARPAAKPKPKAPAKAKPPAASKPTVAQTSGIGPVKSGAAYASQKGSVSESVRQLREMRAASTRRQTGQAAPALSGSKDYSSQFKDMKGGSSRFVAELKKKKPKK